VLCESVRQGKWQSRPAGAHQSGRRSKDVTTWRWIDSAKLVVSLLPSAFRLLYPGTWLFGRSNNRRGMELGSGGG
jgi:hypothetical protein